MKTTLFTAIAGTIGIFCHAAAAQSTTSPAIATQPVAIQSGPGTLADAVVIESPASLQAGAAVEASDGDKKKPESERLKKFKQLTFDRRPSAILKAWLDWQSEAESAAPADAKSDVNGKTDPPATAPSAPKASGKSEAPPAEKPSAETNSAGDKDEAPNVTEKPASDAASKAAREKAESERVAKALAEKIAKEQKQFQRDVTLGDWQAVKTYLAGFQDQEGGQAYRHLLTALAGGSPQANVQLQMALSNLPPAMQQLARQAQQHNEKNVFHLDDIFGLAAAAPGDLDKETLPRLAGLVRLALAQGHAVELLVARLAGGESQPPAIFSRREAAQLLIAAGQSLHAGDFLPSTAEAEEKQDHEALTLIAKHYMALHGKEKKVAHLESAWLAVQAALAGAKLSDDDKQQALRQAVDLAPKIRAELGQQWLNESFTNRRQRGAEILTTIGVAVSQGIRRNPTNPTKRLANLKLQNDSVTALVKAAGDDLDHWERALGLLAENWLREAEIAHQFGTSTSMGPQVQHDMYGNVYFHDSRHNPMAMSGMRQRVQAIDVGELLELRPSEAWQALVNPSLKPKFATLFARLYLKVNEEAEAFPYIKQLAATHADRALELANEFLRVWARNHNPNSQNQRGQYFWIYGFQPRAESIPLTRSKQQRNLDELAAWISRLTALPIGELDEEVLANAFTKCHSTAEVYRLESIERVFGSLAALEPETLGAMTQKMRSNLAGIWRDPSVQQKNKTKRKKQDLQAEVLRGYQVAHRVVDGGLEKYPQHWRLHLAKAALLHDENNYHREIDPNHTFAENRRAALARFAKAAELYAAEVPDLEVEEYTTDVYDTWFYACLGACDLGGIDETNRLAHHGPPLIREALSSLPKAAAKEHFDRFANNLFRRMSGAKPQVKYRYLQAGLDIVGDHRQAREARKVFDYYSDLVSEIKLDATLDGSDVVGHEGPFGVFLDIRHTKEIERESGGFGKYLQNQNNMYFAYNYGRPTNNYRDTVEESIRATLAEHFEVLSITFQEEDVKSHAVEPYGWRVTPYAYLLVRARGPEVDKLPPLKLDLDFLDTSGYVVLPIETSTVPLDCSAPVGELRPVRNLKIAQTLDERQAGEGQLILELKATGNGLVPPLDELVALEFPGFQISQTDEQPVAVARFDPDEKENVIVAERIWSVTMQASAGDKQPERFHFAAVKPGWDEVEMTYQRYDDADMVQVESEFALQQEYQAKSYAWLWPTLLVSSLVCIVGVCLMALRRRPRPQAAAGFEVPADLTPFTVLGLLQQIQHNNGLDTAGHQQLAADIERIERHYYSDDENGKLDLNEISTGWVKRAHVGA